MVDREVGQEHSERQSWDVRGHANGHLQPGRIRFSERGFAVTIAPAILREYPAMNDAQRGMIAHDEGPLLAIAGPGSGKTFSLVLRTINLLLLDKAKPSQVIVCTFTEKAAYELRDRIAAAARRVGYNQDLSELRVGTIHGVCNGLLLEHRHRTPLGNNYDTLDSDLTAASFSV